MKYDSSTPPGATTGLFRVNPWNVIDRWMVKYSSASTGLTMGIGPESVMPAIHTGAQLPTNITPSASIWAAKFGGRLGFAMDARAFPPPGGLGYERMGPENPADSISTEGGIEVTVYLSQPTWMLNDAPGWFSAVLDIGRSPEKNGSYGTAKGGGGGGGGGGGCVRRSPAGRTSHPAPAVPST